MSSKEKLVEVFNDALENAAEYVYVVIKNESLEGHELIINPKVNIDSKLKYYINAYDENLCLNVNKDIQIIIYGWTMSTSDIDELELI